MGGAEVSVEADESLGTGSFALALCCGVATRFSDRSARSSR